jgi:hypothetical protein
VPECEIFNHSDFYDFYNIKSLWVDDFGAKILIKNFNFWGAWHHLNSYAYAQHVLKGPVQFEIFALILIIRRN